MPDGSAQPPRYFWTEKWTAEADADLRVRRLAGESWAAIAVGLGTTPDRARERGRKIGARRIPPPLAYDAARPATRPPLPPGHPISWRLLTDGTCLAGTEYPLPVFLNGPTG
jgi:hypothetical protein